MSTVGVTHQEFFELCNQLYPEQTARVVAEVRAAKLENELQELRDQQEAEEDEEEPVRKKAPAKRNK